jgi:hypothetical protein
LFDSFNQLLADEPELPSQVDIAAQLGILLIALALGVSTSLVSSQDRQLRQLPTATPTIEGVWQVARTGVNCGDPNQVLVGPFPAIMTFHRVRHDNCRHRRPRGLDERVWLLAARARQSELLVPGYLPLAISAIVTGTVHLTDANSFTYSATIQIFDADGNLISNFCGRSTGTRFE